MRRNSSRRAADLNETLIDILVPIGKILLRGNLGVAHLIRAAKQAYLRAAIVHLFPAGVRLNASRLSVVTGLTRKEVSTLISRTPKERASSTTLKQQRALRVLRGWAVDPRFRTSLGAPASLSIRGERRSFSLLVKLYGGDVTPNSVLRELERMEAVRFTPSGALALRTLRPKMRPTHGLAELSQIFADLANTTSEDRQLKAPIFFGFKGSTLGSADQAGRFERIFSSRAAAMLEGADHWFQGQRASGGAAAASDRLRVGIGVYLVKSDVPSLLPSTRRKRLQSKT